MWELNRMCKQCFVIFTHPLYFSYLGEAVIQRHKTNVCCLDERPFSFRTVLNHTSQSTLLLCSYIMNRPVISHTVYQDADVLVHIYCIKQAYTTIPLVSSSTRLQQSAAHFFRQLSGVHIIITSVSLPWWQRRAMLISSAAAQKSTLRWTSW